jgi:hypothetical protein
MVGLSKWMNTSDANSFKRYTNCIRLKASIASLDLKAPLNSPVSQER